MDKVYIITRMDTSDCCPLFDRASNIVFRTKSDAENDLKRLVVDHHAEVLNWYRNSNVSSDFIADRLAEVEFRIEELTLI